MKNKTLQVATKIKIIFAALCLFGAGCGGTSHADSKSSAANHDSDKEKVIAVQTATAAAREVPRFIEVTGSFEADETTEVAPEVAGRVESVLVGEGSPVSTGSVLIRLSESDARLRLDQARASESQAVAQVRQADAEVRRSQAQLGLDKGGKFASANIPAVREARAALRSAESDLKLAQANERRYLNLLESGDTSKLVYDQRRNELEKAQAAVNEARERLQSAENTARSENQGIEAARANLEITRAALENARAATALAEKTLRDAVIRAPFGGIVSSRPAAVGEYVSPNASVTTIVRVNPLKLRLTVPESEAGKIAVGMSVSASVAAFPDRNFAGRVNAVNPNLDPQARTLQVEALCDNPNNLLRPGMFAAAQILLPGGETAVFVPRTALFTNKITESQAVYVISDGIARLRVVQIEPVDPDAPEVRVLSGLNADEQIAVSNFNQLFDGARIKG